MISCGAIIRPGAASPAMLPRPEVAPATMPPAASSMAMIAAVCAVASCSCMRARCPPAMWPLSWASTPMIWFGVVDS
jgi:hypothetical protein